MLTAFCLKMQISRWEKTWEDKNRKSEACWGNLHKTHFYFLIRMMWGKLRSINSDNYGDLQMLPSSDHSFHMHGALHGDCDMHALWQMSAFARSPKKKKKGKKSS